MQILVALALVPALVARPLLSRQDPAPVTPGQALPDFELRTLLGGDGRTKLSDFRGQPVLIAWYSTVFAGMEGARAAVGLDEEFGARGLAVILMEIKNHDGTYMRALQMAELHGAECPLLRNQDLPVTYDDSTGPPPKLILVGADGTLLYAGSYQRTGEVKKLLKEELGKLEKGWGEDPLARKARALGWGQGKLGEARALIDPALAGSRELTQLAGELDRRFEALARSVGHHLEQGEPGRAIEAAGEVAVASAGNPVWNERAQAIVVQIGSPDVLREAELEKKLDALLRLTAKSKPKKGLDEKLRDFASGDANGTNVGARAARLADAVAQAVNEL